MMKNSMIWMGDIAEVFNILKPQDSFTRKTILDLLGLRNEEKEEKVVKEEPEEFKNSLPPFEVEPAFINQTETPLDMGDNGPEKFSDGSEVEPKIKEPERLTPVKTNPLFKSVWVEVESPLRPETEKPLPYEPLFDNRTVNSILKLSLSSNSPNGPIDIDAVVEKIARQETIDSFPTLANPSLFKGIQVLIDVSDAMAPFARDQKELLGKICSVFGKELVYNMKFKNCPIRGAGTGPIWEWQVYNQPKPYVPVVVLSDLGIGGPFGYPKRSKAQEWLEFAKLLKNHCCPLIAFVPYPKERWPQSLIKEINIIQWDRHTEKSNLNKLYRTIKGTYR